MSDKPLVQHEGEGIPQKAQPGLSNDAISNVGRLGRMLGVAILIEFVMLLVSFGVGHHLGQQTVPQSIHVESPVIKQTNEYSIDTHLSIKEEQKQPATIKVSLSPNGNGQTVTQEQVEKLERSLESANSKIEQISNGVKTSTSGSSVRGDGQDKPAPLKLTVDSKVIAIPAERVIPAEKLEPTKKQDLKTDAPIRTTTQSSARPLSEKLGELLGCAKTFCVNYEKTFGTEECKKWESKWSSRMSDTGRDENHLANEKLIELLISIKGKKESGQPSDQREIYDVCMVLCKYNQPNMQLPGPLLEIIKKDDEKDFKAAVNLLMARVGQ